MKMRRMGWIGFLLMGLMVSCGADTAVTPSAQTETGMGMGSGMMARHHAQVDPAYAGLENPVPADEASLEQGAELYALYCVVCHGDGGMGDGPGAAGLDPPPPAIAHTSQMLGDDFLFWRLSEGGAMAPFNSAMPAWKGVLDEKARWDVINYVRALGSGQVTPGQTMGGAAFDPAAEATRHAEMAAEGVAQGILTQAEAETFTAVHAELDVLIDADPEGMMGGMAAQQAQMLARLVADGVITQAEAGTFSAAHEKLLAAGLME